MAGAGSRFAVAGYTVPKPFIQFNEKMMIEHVLDSLSVSDAHYTLIIQQQFLSDNYNDLQKIASKYNLGFITVDELTQGACCTALAAHQVINNDIPVVFADSDNIFDKGVFSDFLCFTRHETMDGCLLTVKSEKACYSYASLDNKDNVIETKEKEVISNHAIAGIYYFSHGFDFCKSAIDLLIYGKKTKGEFYMSNVFNRAIKKYEKKIKVYDIEESKFHCVGTPEQLDAYVKMYKEK